MWKLFEAVDFCSFPQKFSAGPNRAREKESKKIESASAGTFNIQAHTSHWNALVNVFMSETCNAKFYCFVIPWTCRHCCCFFRYICACSFISALVLSLLLLAGVDYRKFKMLSTMPSVLFSFFFSYRWYWTSTRDILFFLFIYIVPFFLNWFKHTATKNDAKVFDQPPLFLLR